LTPGQGEIWATTKYHVFVQKPGPQELLARALHQYSVPLFSAGETVHWLPPRAVCERTTDEQTLSVQTWTSYEVAPETSPQSSVGLAETRMAPLDGLNKLGGVGVGHVVVKLQVPVQEPDPQELPARARHQYCVLEFSAGETVHWLPPTSAIVRTTDLQALSVQTSTSYEVASETSAQSRVGATEIPTAPLDGLDRLVVPGV
jgi:hypothetical protein